MLTITDERINIIAAVLSGVGEALLDCDCMYEEMQLFYDEKTSKFNLKGFEALVRSTPKLMEVVESANIQLGTIAIYSRLRCVEGECWRMLGKGKALALESTAKAVGVEKFSEAVAKLDLTKPVDLGNTEERLAFVNEVRESVGLSKNKPRKKTIGELKNEPTKEEYKRACDNLKALVEEIYSGVASKERERIRKLAVEHEVRALFDFVALDNTISK